MKHCTGWWMVAAMACPIGLTAQGGASPASITLFNSGRVLVRRTLPVSVPSGASTQSLDLGLFNPTTFTTLDPGVSVSGIRFDPSWSEDALLRRNVGKHFQFVRSASATATSTATATLIALDPERWKWDSSGKVIFGRPGQLQWPSEMVPTSPVTDVTLRSDRARPALKVMYETSGAAWNASYRIFLGAQGRIEGVAEISAGPLDLADVEVQLLAGDIGRAPATPMYMKSADMAGRAMAAPMSEMAATSESVGETHVYTLPGRLSFVPGLQFTAALFETTPARGERRYSMGGGLPYYGGFQQQADETPVPIDVAYRFERKGGTPFGDLVLPGGGVSLYDADNAGRIQLIGQGTITHTPAGKELLLSTGTAFDVTATRVQTDYSTTRSAIPNTTTRTIAMSSYRVTLKNAKDSAVTVEVREDRGGEWSIVESSIPPEKRSSTRYVFTVPVPANGTAVLTYRVRVVW
jgi:hypothetical protein